ncbi:MAG: DUF1700 domain-containing protein [Lachnospiraceae bacterium]|nr:DUF1700 domain-containing protein [Lachnospiraceae bacterium]
MEQFFKELEDALKGEVSEYEYTDSMTYYRDYFREQMSMGKSEDEVIKQLGSPRLIAKSIIDARGSEEESGRSGYYDNTTDSGDNNTNPVSYGQNTIMKKLGGILTIILILLLVGFVLRAVLPLILIIVPVLLIVRLFRGE